MKKLNKFLCYFLILSIVFTLLPYRVDAAKKIELSAKSITLINNNKNISLKNVPKNQYKNIKWKSTNPKVAKVQNPYSNVCTIKFVGTGTCYITATLNKKNYKCKVTAYSRNDYINKVFKENFINTSIQETKSNILYEFSVNKKFSSCGFKIEYFKNGKCIEKYQKIENGLMPNEKYSICFDKPKTSNGIYEYDDYKITMCYLSAYYEKYFKPNTPSCISATFSIDESSSEYCKLSVNLTNNSEDTKLVQSFIALYNEGKLVDIIKISGYRCIYPKSYYLYTHIFWKNTENGKMKTFSKDGTEFDDIKVVISSATTQ